MNKEIKKLEQAAIDAHRRGERWETFWHQHAEQARAVEPYSRQRFKRLFDRLVALVASGDTAGMMPVGDDGAMSWTLDDEANKPADTGTAARWQG
jgi:hypothetical protein